MVVNESLVFIHGDHRNRFPDLFLKFRGYWPTGRVFRAASRAEADSFVGYEDRDQDGSMEIVQKPVFVLNGWTVIDDPELILMDDVEGLEAISTLLKSLVLAVQSLDHAKKYAFRCAHKSKLRTLISYHGKITVNEGEPLTEESRTNPDRFTEEDLWQLLRAFHIDYQTVSEVKEFQVYELEESEVGELPLHVETEAPPKEQFQSKAKLREEDFKSPEVKSPWWKFW